MWTMAVEEVTLVATGLWFSKGVQHPGRHASTLLLSDRRYEASPDRLFRGLSPGSTRQT